MFRKIAKKFFYNFYWNYSVNKFKKIKQEKEILLILGVGRSGTTWISNTLAKTATPIRFFEEPLFHINPKLKLCPINDHTSIKYKKLGENHRLLASYRILTNNKIPFGFIDENFIKRFDKDYKKVLIKEVHTLLATENLIKKLDCKVLLIQRNPLYLLDSLIYAQSINTLYLKNEFNFIISNKFLNNFFIKEKKLYIKCKNEISAIKDSYTKTLLNYIFTIYLINKMFDAIAEKEAKVLVEKYENFISNPEDIFKKVSLFLGIEYVEKSYIFNKETHQDENYMINKDPKKQIKRKFKSLTPPEVNYINNFFKKYDINF